MKFRIMLTVLAGVFTFMAGYAVCGFSYAQEMSCSEILANKQDLREQYKTEKHNERKAFNNWDKYYKELHSIEYGGTERPLADTAKACREGNGPNEHFCKDALKRYDELAGKEAEAKKELDATKENAEQLGDNMRAFSQKAKEKGCE